MKSFSTTFATALLLTVLFSLTAPPAIAQTSKPERPAQTSSALSSEDEAGVRKTVMGFEQAWNTHDMKLLATLFREDAQFINVVGMHWQGRDAIVKAHAIFHDLMFKDCRLKTDLIEARPLGSGYAIAVVTTTQDGFTTPSGQIMPKAQTKQTYVLAKGPLGWQFVHGQNVRIDADAVKNDPVKSSPK
ncbi:MAG: hypothetical protein K0Q55_2061 [Verrucomicrobia bacterium]|jgi:uncharacterized protein (TIGR02246 family)|nr:hypothetical protein [Verrucomicrobiota bacterium]